LRVRDRGTWLTYLRDIHARLSVAGGIQIHNPGEELPLDGSESRNNEDMAVAACGEDSGCAIRGTEIAKQDLVSGIRLKGAKACQQKRRSQDPLHQMLSGF
jgi:hypothetical protein